MFGYAESGKLYGMTMIKAIKLDSQRLFAILTAFFIASLVVADIIGCKAAYIGGFSLGPLVIPQMPISSGIIAFPLTFVLTDLVNEFYGQRAARFLTFLGLGVAVYVYFILTAANSLPATPFSLVPQDAFSQVIGGAQTVFVGSLIAYLIGQLVDIQVFFVLRKLTQEKFLWLRATGSTVVSQLIDSIVVTFIVYGPKFFANKVALLDVLHLGFNNYSIKFLVALSLTPLCYLGHAIIHKLLHPSKDPELDISEFEFSQSTQA